MKTKISILCDVVFLVKLQGITLGSDSLESSLPF